MNVLLDTNVILAENYNFHSEKMESLIQFSEVSSVSVYITEITNAEIRKRIQKDAGVARSYFIAGMNAKMRIFKNFEAFRSLGNDIEDYQFHDKLLEEYDNFLSRAQISIIPHSVGPIHRLMHAYFEGLKPFDTEKKKHEFPDALSLLCAETYLKSVKDKAFVISKDPDFPALLESLDLHCLTSIESLELVLDKLNDGYEDFRAFLADSEAEILKLIEDKFEEAYIHIDSHLVGVEETDRVFESVEMTEFGLISITPLKAVIATDINIDFNLSFGFDDPDMAHYDSEIKAMLNYGDTRYGTEEFHETHEVEVLFERGSDKEDWQISIEMPPIRVIVG